jgi:hypothetical protein
VKEGVLDIGKSAGTITNPVGNFSIGNAAVTAVAAGAVLATAKGYKDSKSTQNSTAINNNVGQYTTILSPTESVNLVTTNTVARDRVASALYYQQVGSRNGQTIAQSDVAYAALTDNEKSVYRDRTTAQIASLVADGYIKINRTTQNVSITAEKAKYLMTEFYSNLPQKLRDNLQKTADSLVDNNYKERFEFAQNDLDATVGFFVKRGFARQPAEDTAYIILQQAKIDSVPVGQILDQLTYTNPAQLSELVSTILNANRYKSSRLGVRNTRAVKDTVSRNIID